MNNFTNQKMHLNVPGLAFDWILISLLFQINIDAGTAV